MMKITSTSLRRIASILAGLTLIGNGALAHATSVGTTGLNVHPARYQSAQQTDRDEFECHLRAKRESGLDSVRAASATALPSQAQQARTMSPSQRALGAEQHAAPEPAVPQHQAARNEQRNVYDRGFAACMAARGYVVR